MSQGGREPITWEKADEYSNLVFYDQRGGAAHRKPRKSYLGFLSPGQHDIRMTGKNRPGDRGFFLEREHCVPLGDMDILVSSSTKYGFAWSEKRCVLSTPKGSAKAWRWETSPRRGSIIRDTISIAWPSVLESFFVCLAGMMDTIMVGFSGLLRHRRRGPEHPRPKIPGACGVPLHERGCAPRWWPAGRAKGTGRGANRVLRMALLVTLVLTAVVSVAFVGLRTPSSGWWLSARHPRVRRGVPADHHGGHRLQHRGPWCSTPPSGGAGNTRIAMTTNLVSNVVNICFNYLLIGGNFGFPRPGGAGGRPSPRCWARCAPAS